MSFKIKTEDGVEQAQTASEAVAMVDAHRDEEGLVVVEVEPETASPKERTRSQEEIEARQQKTANPG